LEQEEISQRVGRLARLGRQRDFSLDRFRRALSEVSARQQKGEILRQLLTEWTGLPHSVREAEERWIEVERCVETLRRSLGPPVGLQTALMHQFHSRMGLLKEPRVLSEGDLAVLRVNAITDPLTGLYNRRFLLDHLAREIARAERTHGILSVLMMDLKGFKGINDHFGHPVGDTVLVRTARVIRDMLRAVDAGCRWGGDEFVVVLPNTDLFSAFAVAERIRKKVATTALPGRGVELGMHYGIASYPSDGHTTDFLLKIADLRLYDCREQSNFAKGDRRHHPRFAPNQMNLRVFPHRDAGSWTAAVLDVSYGGIAFKAARGSKWPARWSAEISQTSGPESHSIRLRAVNAGKLSRGGMRVGCCYA